MRPWSIGTLRPLSIARQRLSLVQQFLVLTSLAIGVNMLAIGYWAEDRLFKNAVSTTAETSAPYFEGALSPYVQSLWSLHELTPDEQRRISDLLRNTQLAKRVTIINIWTLDGRLVYSTGNITDDKHELSEPIKAALLQAAAGKVAVNFQGHDAAGALARPRRVEIYVPIYKAGTLTPVAVGEFDEDISFLKQTIADHRSTMWLSTAFFTIVTISLIYLIVARGSRIIERQQMELVSRLRALSRLARRNDRLRQIADKSRLNAAIANENYLAGIGADLHDGPIQVLGLAMLRSDALPANSHAEVESWRRGISHLIQQAIQELRSLASGLVLPEIAEITLEETIRLAASRHESLTGTSVLCSVGPLPENASTALKLCTYRVVQECLSNSFKHARGLGQSVTANAAGTSLELSVVDHGVGLAKSHDEAHPSLGLLGLNNRVKSLRGTLTIYSDHEGGTDIQVRIPLRPNLAR